MEIPYFSLSIFLLFLHGVTTQKVVLKGGPTSYEGNVILLDANGNEKGPICVNGFDANAGTVVCKQLGLTLTPSKPFSNAAYGTVTPPFALQALKCAGTEADLTKCQLVSPSNDCTANNQGASVVCDPPKVSLPIAGVQGVVSATPFGSPNPSPGPICAKDFNILAANVICVQLSYIGADSFSVDTTVNAGFTYSGVTCKGTEKIFDQCGHDAVASCPVGSGAAVVVCHRPSVALILGGSMIVPQYNSWGATNQFELFLPGSATCPSPLTPLQALPISVSNPFAAVVNLGDKKPSDVVIFCGSNPSGKYQCWKLTVQSATLAKFQAATWDDISSTSTNGPKISHIYGSSVLVDNKEIYIFDDSYMEIFTLPADLSVTVGPVNNIGSWRKWDPAPGTNGPIFTGGGACIVYIKPNIYVIGGKSTLNKVQIYATDSKLWYDGGTIPFGQVKNSRCIVVPGSPGIPNKILVPIYNDFDTNTPAGLYVPPSVLGNSGTWEPVVPDKPMNLFGACAINLKPGDDSSIFFYGGGIDSGSTLLRKFSRAVSAAVPAKLTTQASSTSLTREVNMCVAVSFPLEQITGSSATDIPGCKAV